MTGSKCSIASWTIENKQVTFPCFANISAFSALSENNVRCPTNTIKKIVEAIFKTLVFKS